MALSAESRRILAIAMGDKQKAEEIADAIDATEGALTTQAANVAAIAAPEEATGPDVAATVNLILTALKNAGLMEEDAE